jgi:hypothetical protein
MAPTSSVRINSTLRVSKTIIKNEPPSINISDADFTLTATQVLENHVSVSGLTANRTVTFPTGGDLGGATPNVQAYDTFIFYISNDDNVYSIILEDNTGCVFGLAPKTIGPNRIVMCRIYFLTTTTYSVQIIAIGDL